MTKDWKAKYNLVVPWEEVGYVAKDKVQDFIETQIIAKLIEDSAIDLYVNRDSREELKKALRDKWLSKEKE